MIILKAMSTFLLFIFLIKLMKSENRGKNASNFRSPDIWLLEQSGETNLFLKWLKLIFCYFDIFNDLHLN